MNKRYNDDGIHDYVARMEDWLAQIDDGRAAIVEMEIMVRALYSSARLERHIAEQFLELLSKAFIANARGAQGVRWCRRYPPDFGEKWPAE